MNLMTCLARYWGRLIARSLIEARCWSPLAPHFLHCINAMLSVETHRVSEPGDPGTGIPNPLKWCGAPALCRPFGGPKQVNGEALDFAPPKPGRVRYGGIEGPEAPSCPCSEVSQGPPDIRFPRLSAVFATQRSSVRCAGCHEDLANIVLRFRRELGHRKPSVKFGGCGVENSSREPSHQPQRFAADDEVRAAVSGVAGSSTSGTLPPFGLIPFRNLNRSLSVDSTSVVFLAMIDL